MNCDGAGVLQNTFLLLPRIGLRTERTIWKQSIQDWQAWLDAPKVRGFSLARKAAYDELLREASKRLLADDGEWFASRIPRSEHWRLYHAFKERVLFLDIETTGWYSVTMVGMSNGYDMKTMVRGSSLDRAGLLHEIKNARLLVTYNGCAFDIPVLEHYFGFKLHIPHVDLRTVSRRLGLVGGLKRIERELGIIRDEDVQDMQSGEAPLLWHAWRSTGERGFLERLAKYNAEDVLNLKLLAEKLIPRLWEKTYSRAGKELVALTQTHPHPA